MNPFAEALNDEIYIVNGEGDRQGPFKAAVADGQAVFFDVEADVQEGFKVVRALPKQREESFTILEANYSPGLRHIPPSYTLELRKDSALKTEGAGRGATSVININDSQQFLVGDGNVQNVGASLEELVRLIDGSSASAGERAAARRKLRELVENPTVAAVLGSAATVVLGMLGVN